MNKKHISGMEGSTMVDEKSMPKTEEEWKKALTPEQYNVLRMKGTEAPGSGHYLHEKRKGTYACSACGDPLFSSDTKFDSGKGWRSFDQALPRAAARSKTIEVGSPRAIRRRRPLYRPTKRQFCQAPQAARPGRRCPASASINARRSALTWSLSVVHRPCGAP